MRYEIEGESAFPIIKIWLNKGESVKAESGSMVALSSGLELVGKIEGGIGKAFGRLFSGESFFMQTIEAVDSDGWALLTTPVPGGIIPIEMDGTNELLVQKDGFVASTEGVSFSTKVQKLARGFLSGEGFFIIKLGGKGTAFLSSYGSIYPIELKENETVLIDNGHLIAWDSYLDYKITKGAKSWVSSFTSGEGFACRFTGPGKVLVQTRSPKSFVHWLYPKLPIPDKN